VNLPPTLDKLLLVVRRDLLTSLRYGLGFWLRPLGLAVEIAGLYYLACAIGPGFRPDGVAYFPFVLIGTSYATFLLSGVSAFVDSVQESQMTGTIEVLMTSATPAPEIVLFTALSSYGGYLLLHVLSVVAGLLAFRVPLPAVNWPGLAMVFLLSVAVAAGIGMFAAGVQLALQKGGALVWLLGTASFFLTGTMFPVSALPRPLQLLAACIPVTYALDGFRLALLKGAGLDSLAPSLAALATFAAILLPLGVLFFSFILRRCRTLGTLSFY
jgi:ABC-2 type transport system permease protein